MKTYQKHLESTHAIGESVSLLRKPIFRSSAIFPVMHNAQFSSRVLYMGYWLLKRHIPEIQLLISLRSQSGVLLLRQSIVVDTPKAASIYLADLINLTPNLSADSDFLGSLELEIFSTRDLVYPYPAFVINYFNDDFCTSVHTTGRIYNDIEDLQENDAYSVPECGFDIQSDTQFSPFFAFVNGIFAASEQIVHYTIVDEDNQTSEGIITLKDLKPYQTLVVHFKDHIDLKAILKGKKGAIKLRHNFKGFFPRFLAGNFQSDKKALSITHTYYDSSDVKDQNAYWSRSSEELNDSSVFIPLFIEQNLYTDLVFYPIYSPSEFTIDMIFYDENGQFVAQLLHYKYIQTQNKELFTLKFKEILANNFSKTQLEQIKGVNLIKNWIDKNHIPTRLKFGLNIGTQKQNIDLPTNICFNSQIGNPNVLQKKGTFKWAPILNHHQSKIVFTNAGTPKIYKQNATLQITFYRENDNQTLGRAFDLKPFGQHTIEILKDPELQQFLQNQTGWVTCIADNPFVNGWYFDFQKSGVVAGDHSF